MPRQFKGSAIVKIPMNDIIRQYTDLMNVGLNELAEMAVEMIMKNTLRFGTRQGVPVSKKLRKHIRSSISRYQDEDGVYIAGAFSPHAHLLEDGHIKWLWGRQTGEFVKGFHFVYDAEQDLMDEAARVVAKAIGNHSVIIRS